MQHQVQLYENPKLTFTALICWESMQIFV